MQDMRNAGRSTDDVVGFAALGGVKISVRSVYSVPHVDGVTHRCPAVQHLSSLHLTMIKEQEWPSVAVRRRAPEGESVQGTETSLRSSSAFGNRTGMLAMCSAGQQYVVFFLGRHTSLSIIGHENLRYHNSSETMRDYLLSEAETREAKAAQQQLGMKTRN